MPTPATPNAFPGLPRSIGLPIKVDVCSTAPAPIEL